MYTNLETIYRLLVLVATALKQISAVPRHFDKFWNNSLVFPAGPNVRVQSLVMLNRAECVSWCARTPTCCCTQWVLTNNTCTILEADRPGLANATEVVSSIDSTIHSFCN